MEHRPSLRTGFLAAGQLIVAASFFVSAVGCSRSHYRRRADAESYRLIQSRQSDPRWALPRRPVEPDQNSRMYLANEKDCGPKPPDDVAAHRYMMQPDRKCNPYYCRMATRSSVENPAWIDLLPRNAEGEIELTQPLAVDLGLLNSREYQSEFENVYFAALALSSDRFEFDTQWFWGFDKSFTATGSDLGGSRLLELSDRFGFSRSLAGGGQFATEVLNGLSWDFGSGGVQQGSAAIISTFTQPLLRGAFRHVRLESLTQSERDLLYQVRDFARFRRLFYVDIIEAYLGLLTQSQAIRNSETNVENLRQNLEEHQFYSQLKLVSQVQVDQVFQQYQNGRRALLALQQARMTSEDQYKFSLGLPAWVSFDIDESLLKPFELVDPQLIRLQDETQSLYEALVQFLPPRRAPAEALKGFYEEYVQLRDQVAEKLPSVEADLQRWQKRLQETDPSRLNSDDRLDFQQQKVLAAQIESSLIELRKSLESRQEFNKQVLGKLDDYEKNPPQDNQEDNKKTLQEILDSAQSLEDITLEDILPDEKDDTAIAAWKEMEGAIGRRLREEIAELYVAQTQITLFLIDIEPRRIVPETAISFAHHNRLDLMNSKAIVMDSFRRVEVAADALESDLDVSGQVIVGSDANSNSPFKLDSKNNQYNVTVQFDGPLNRLNERNIYRASQIVYQQASRDYMATKDQIANEIRLILRRMEFSRISFQIARQQVVVASRQVDQAQIDLRRSSQADSNLTIVLLQALDGLLGAKDSLIVTWVDYRVQKLRLFAALEMLYLDDQGTWINEQTGLEMIEGYQAIDPEYFPPQWFGTSRQENVEIEQLEPIQVDSQFVESE